LIIFRHQSIAASGQIYSRSRESRDADIIKREIPSKNLPSVRDKETGKFAKISDKNKVSAYPTEYILIMEK